jgi:hypothetical protein
VTKKLEQFKKRNKKRNAHLYQSNKVEGTDYIVCPVSKERLSMIKTSYIERVLEMSVEEYDQLYPGMRGVSEARRKNIRKALHEIDPDTGKTKYQISQEKAKKILSEIDENGLTGYQRKGQKTRATHMSKIDEFGRNGYSQLASKAIIKGNLTKAEKGLILDPTLRDEYYRYKSVVLYVTEKYRKEITEGYKTGLAGIPGAYHIDHMFSIMQGYKNCVSPILVGSKYNLKMIPWKDNLSKHSASSISLDTLLSNSNYTIEQSQQEFDYFIDLISDDIKNKRPVSGACLMEKFYESNLCAK